MANDRKYRYQSNKYNTEEQVNESAPLSTSSERPVTSSTRTHN